MLKAYESQKRVSRLKYISPSQYSHFCLRKTWYAWQPSYEKHIIWPDDMDLDGMWRTSRGTAFHAFQAKLLAPAVDHLGYRAWGLWQCSNCHSTKTGFQPKACANHITITTGSKDIKRPCSKHGVWEYQEAPVPKNKFNIVGTSDLVLKNKFSTIVIDHKYTFPKAFQAFTSGGFFPKKNLQQMWLYMIGHDAPEGQVVYYNTAEPLEIYSRVITTPPENFVHKIRKLGKIINDIKRMKLPPRVCKSPTVARAKRCPFKKICFSR